MGHQEIGKRERYTILSQRQLGGTHIAAYLASRTGRQRAQHR